MEYTSTNQIQQIVDVAISNIQHAASVNTIIGQPITTMQGSTILPVSQVSFGFVAGGGEYGTPKKLIGGGHAQQFAGGSGGGATLTPVGFLVINGDDIKMVKAENNSNVDKILDLAKGLFSNAKI